MKKQHCNGCRNNFYNSNNGLGVKECWSFEDAKIVWRIPIGNWETPPYKHKAIRIPNCYHTESQGTHYIKKESLDSRGCWK
jgi:hypothetical protein